MRLHLLTLFSVMASFSAAADKSLHLAIGDPARKDKEVKVVLDAITDAWRQSGGGMVQISWCAGEIRKCRSKPNSGAANRPRRASKSATGFAVRRHDLPN